MMPAVIAGTALLLFSLFIPLCEGINPSSTVSAIDGSLVGQQCPGIVKLECIGVYLTSLRWTYNDLSPIHTFLSDSQPTSTIPRNSNPAFPMVELQMVIQHSNDPDFANFTSILTVNLTQLVQQNVTSITCGDPGTSNVLGVNVSIIQPSVPPSPKLTEVTASYQSKTLSSVTAVWMKFEDICDDHNQALSYVLSLNSSVETEVSQASCEGQVCTGTLQNISGEGGHILSLTTESIAGSSNTTMYPDPIQQQSQQYFSPNFESLNCQVTARCISSMDLDSNSTCTAQYSHGNLSTTTTALIDASFKLPITNFNIKYKFQFSVLFDDLLKVQVFLEENIPMNNIIMTGEIITMAVGLISCAASLILLAILLCTMAKIKKELRILIIIMIIIMICCTTALIIAFGIVAGIQPNTCDGRLTGLIVCLVISLVITIIVIVLTVLVLVHIKLRKNYTVSKNEGTDLSMKSKDEDNHEEKHQDVTDFQTPGTQETEDNEQSIMGKVLGWFADGFGSEY